MERQASILFTLLTLNGISLHTAWAQTWPNLQPSTPNYNLPRPIQEQYGMKVYVLPRPVCSDQIPPGANSA